MKLPPELEGKLAVDVPTTGKLLGIGRRQAYAAVKDGSIPSLRLQGRILVPVPQLLALIGVDEADPTRAA